MGRPDLKEEQSPAHYRFNSSIKILLKVIVFNFQNES